MTRRLLLVLTAAAVAACSSSPSTTPAPTPRPTPAPSGPAPSATSTAEQRLHAAIRARYGDPPPGARYSIDDEVDLARAICTVNRRNFHVFADDSTAARSVPVGRRLDDLFRLSVHYLCPAREAELPPVPTAAPSPGA